MKQSDKIVEYLQGDRKGKAANRLEREALTDPFLYEALEGLTDTEGEHIRAINRLKRRIYYKVQPPIRWRKVVLFLFLGGLCLGAVLFFLFFYKAPQLIHLPKIAPLEEKVFVVTDTFGTKTKVQTIPEDNQRISDVPSGKIPSEKNENPWVDSLKKGTERSGVSYPIGGYDAFYQYIQDSLVYPEDALQDSLEGEIRLSFVVNKYGRPSHIRVVKWITYSCNREAIRLLSRGPRWAYTGSEEPTFVNIPFHLPR